LISSKCLSNTEYWFDVVRPTSLKKYCLMSEVVFAFAEHDVTWPVSESVFLFSRW
jgi:hypothetical protein